MLVSVNQQFGHLQVNSSLLTLKNLERSQGGSQGSSQGLEEMADVSLIQEILLVGFKTFEVPGALIYLFIYFLKSLKGGDFFLSFNLYGER